MNLLEETKEILEDNGKTIEDIEWIGTGKHYIDKTKALELFDNEYDNGYGGQQVACNLLVVGKNRMIKLAHALDAKKINYIWYVFTNDKNAIDSPNVVYMNPRFDISRWMQQADYVVQLSDTEACSYTINEALYRNIPIIVTPLPYLKEIGYRDNKTGYTLDFDCSNIDDVVDKILTKPVFKFKHLKDNYDNILIKSKSQYYEEVLRPVTVKVIINQGYTDLMVGHHVHYGEIIENVPIGRARGLVTSNLVEIIEGENNDGNN